MCVCVCACVSVRILLENPCFSFFKDLKHLNLDFGRSLKVLDVAIVVYSRVCVTILFFLTQK